MATILDVYTAKPKNREFSEIKKYILLPRSWKYFRENLRENENIFENILGYLLSIHEKTRFRKSHASVPLSVAIFLYSCCV